MYMNEYYKQYFHESINEQSSILELFEPATTPEIHFQN